jgi:hypothetical protein
MTTIKLSGGDLGGETMLVRCNLADASAPIEVECNKGEGFTGTQYQCADARHTIAGLIEFGKKLAAREVEMPEDEFDCEAEEVVQTYTVSDSNSADAGLTYDEAVARISEWYEDSDEWATGDGDADLHAAINESIESVGYVEDGDIDDLRRYVEKIRDAVAIASNAKSFAGHGNYFVSAADSIGLTLSVSAD